MYRFSNSLPYLLARLGVRMGDLFSRVIRHEKLTLPMYRVLAALSEQGHPLGRCLDTVAHRRRDEPRRALDA